MCVRGPVFFYSVSMCVSSNGAGSWVGCCNLREKQKKMCVLWAALTAVVLIPGRWFSLRKKDTTNLT